MRLLGSWRVADATATLHTYYFAAGGELILSVPQTEGLRRSILTWEQRGEQLAIDQPSDPRIDLMSLYVASEHTRQIDNK